MTTGARATQSRTPPRAQLAILMLDVVVIHIRQHREVGTVEAQVLKRLACSADVMRTLAAPCAAISQAGNTRAHNEARIRTSRFQDVRDHRGGRCLAVRAGHTNLRLVRAEQGEAFRASQDPQTALSRFNQFRVLRWNRIADHRHLRCADVIGVVFRKNLDAERGEMLQLRRLLQIAPADLPLQTNEIFGHRAHAVAADADNVDASGMLGRCAVI